MAPETRAKYAVAPHSKYSEYSDTPVALGDISVSDLRKMISDQVSLQASTEKKQKRRAREAALSRLQADAEVVASSRVSAASKASTAAESVAAPPSSASSAFHELLYQEAVVSKLERAKWREEAQSVMESAELDACTFAPTICKNSQQLARGVKNLKVRTPEVLEARRRRLQEVTDAIEEKERHEIEMGISSGRHSSSSRASSARSLRSSSAPRYRYSPTFGSSDASPPSSTASNSSYGGGGLSKREEVFLKSVEQYSQERRDRIHELRSNLNYETSKKAGETFAPKIHVSQRSLKTSASPGLTDNSLTDLIPTYANPQLRLFATPTKAATSNAQAVAELMNSRSPPMPASALATGLAAPIC